MTADHRGRRTAPPPPARRRPETHGEVRPPARHAAGRGPDVAAGPDRSRQPGATRRLRGHEGTGHRDPGPSRRRDPRPGRDDRASGPAVPAWPDRLLRGLAGVLAGGLVVLALGMLAVWIGADHYGLPGPGGGVVIGHLVGAGVAVAGQRIADRRPDRTGTLAALVVVLVTVVVLAAVWFL